MKRTLLLSFIYATLFFSCKKPQGFDYRDVKNIKIEKLGFDKTSLKMDLVYFNPNNFGVTLKNVDCDIYIDNSFLGHYKLDTIMKIEKRSEFSLPSNIQIEMKNVYKNALSVLVNKEITLNVKGTSKVSKFGISITVPFDYKGKQRISIF